MLCVPEFSANLLSVSSITKSGNRVSFVDNGCEIYDHNNVLVCKANLEDGVYKLPVSVEYAMMSSRYKESLLTWHWRLGHVNFSDLRKLLKSAGIDFTNMDEFVCESCVMAKHARQPFRTVASVHRTC